MFTKKPFLNFTSNRFSADLNKIDNIMGESLYRFTQNLCDLVTSLAVACSSSPYMLLPLIPILAVNLSICRLYRASSRELVRMEAISKSPIISAVSRSVAMRDTIRAFFAQRNFVGLCESLADENGKLQLVSQLCYQFTSVYINITVTMILAAVLTLFVLHREAVDTR